MSETAPDPIAPSRGPDFSIVEIIEDPDGSFFVPDLIIEQEPLTSFNIWPIVEFEPISERNIFGEGRFQSTRNSRLLSVINAIRQSVPYVDLSLNNTSPVSERDRLLKTIYSRSRTINTVKEPVSKICKLSDILLGIHAELIAINHPIAQILETIAEHNQERITHNLSQLTRPVPVLSDSDLKQLRDDVILTTQNSYVVISCNNILKQKHLLPIK